MFKSIKSIKNLVGKSDDLTRALKNAQSASKQFSKLDSALKYLDEATVLAKNANKLGDVATMAKIASVKTNIAITKTSSSLAASTAIKSSKVLKGFDAAIKNIDDIVPSQLAKFQAELVSLLKKFGNVTEITNKLKQLQEINFQKLNKITDSLNSLTKNLDNVNLKGLTNSLKDIKTYSKQIKQLTKQSDQLDVLFKTTITATGDAATTAGKAAASATEQLAKQGDILDNASDAVKKAANSSIAKKVLIGLGITGVASAYITSIILLADNVKQSSENTDYKIISITQDIVNPELVKIKYTPNDTFIDKSNVQITESNSSPSINGTHQITSVQPGTFFIKAKISSPGDSGKIKTAASFSEYYTQIEKEIDDTLTEDNIDTIEQQNSSQFTEITESQNKILGLDNTTFIIIIIVILSIFSLSVSGSLLYSLYSE